MKLIAAALALGFLSSCETRVEIGVTHRAQAVTYDIHCAKKHTSAEAALVGAADDPACLDWSGKTARMADGCLSPGLGADPINYPHAADEMPLGQVTFMDGRPYPGDEAEGYLCCVCDAVEQKLTAENAKLVADGGVPRLVVPPPLTPQLVAGTLMMSDDNLWSVRAGGDVFMLVGGVMVKQLGAPPDWPIQ